jgi:hypothetical protein
MDVITESAIAMREIQVARECERASKDAVRRDGQQFWINAP